MANDIKSQLVEEVNGNKSPMICFQLDESTGVASFAQLIVYVRYVHEKIFRDELLFC